MKEKLVNQIEVVYKPLNGKMNPPRFLDVSHFVEFFKFKFNPKDLRQSFDRKASVGGAVYETSLFPSLRHSSIGFKEKGWCFLVDGYGDRIEFTIGFGYPMDDKTLSLEGALQGYELLFQDTSGITVASKVDYRNGFNTSVILPNLLDPIEYFVRLRRF